MSKEKMWKGFDQLLVSPSVGYRRLRRRQQRSRSIKHDSVMHMRDQDDGWQIDDHSDDDTAPSGRHENETLPSTITPSVPQSLNPAEVTINRRNQSDSEIEHISEEDCRPQYDTTSESSDSDDCLAIKCRKSRMTRLQFVDKKSMKRRRITDDMDVSFSAGTSRAKNRIFQDAASPKRFKAISTLNRSTSGLNNSVTGAAGDRSTRCWKSFDESFTDLEESCIEENTNTPSPENTNSGQLSRTETLNIDAISSSIGENSCGNRNLTSDLSISFPSKSFYVATPETKSKNKHHPKSSPLGALALVLNDRSSRQQLWQHAVTSGTIQPDRVVKLESIERVFGRVMLRFFTATNEADSCVQERIENIIFVDQGDKQLRLIHAGMEIALEIDEQIAPHRVSHNKLVHLGITKLCPLSSIAK